MIGDWDVPITNHQSPITIHPSPITIFHRLTTKISPHRIWKEMLIEKSETRKAFMPAVICAAVILGLSVMPGIQLPETIFAPDKLGHFAAYGLLSWLTLNGLRKTGRRSALFSLLAITAVSGYGILLEFVQWAFFPHRYFEVWDMFANIAGAVCSYLTMRGVGGFKRVGRFSHKPPKPR